jgi:hypothetical protein
MLGVSKKRVNEALVRATVELKIEDRSKLRVDTTVVESDIHYPSDSMLLWDGVLTITRLVLEHLEPKLADVAAGFPDRRHRRGKHDRHFRRTYRDLPPGQPRSQRGPES